MPEDGTEQARLDVGDTRKTIAIKDEKRVTTGDLAALAMCAHRYDPDDLMGWYTHEFGDVVRQWITSNVGSVIARLSPHCEDTRGDLPPLHRSDDLWVGDTETEPTQTKLVTDGGLTREDPTDIVSNGGRNADGTARMLSRWTFQYEPARSIVEKYLSGRVLNACAGKTHLDHDGEIVRNDLNPDRDADTHHDVAEIAAHFDALSFDTVVFDPPFDEKQAETKYDGLHAKDVYAALEQFNELVRPGGRVVTFGWNSWGMRSFSAFERVETTLLQRGPIHRDVIVTVDRRAQHSLASDGGRSVNTDTERSNHDA